MALETVAHLDDLNASNPVSDDGLDETDNHLRNIKTALLTDFPNVNDACDFTPTEANVLASVTPGAAAASKALVLDASKEVSGITTITATTYGAGALADGMTATTQSDGDGSTKPATTAYVDAHGFIQRVDGTPYTTWNAGGTAFPFDDSIPQNDEGKQYVTVAITPTNAANILLITADVGCFGLSVAATATMAIFQDATANAIAVISSSKEPAGYTEHLHLEHRMVAGTGSETTFKLRVGPSTGDMYVNGNASERKFGGLSAVTLSVTEVTP